MESATHVSQWGPFQVFPHYGEMRCRYWFRQTPFRTWQQHVEMQRSDGSNVETADTDAGWIANWTSLPRNATPLSFEYVKSALAGDVDVERRVAR